MADTERLPGPRLEDYEWQLEAACRVLDSTIFFHPPAARNIQRDSRIARAKAICRDCPAIVACRAWALRTMEPYGIWGGLSEDARTTLLGVPTLRWGGRRTTEDLREEQKSRLRRLLDDQHCDYYFKSDKDLSSYLMTRTRNRRPSSGNAPICRPPTFQPRAGLETLVTGSIPDSPGQLSIPAITDSYR